MRNGSTYILETQKAPLWTIANTIAIMRKARARRKTMVFGTVSDYAGKGGETHRKVARKALQVSDRVIFVGPQAGHVSKLRQGKLKDRVFSFVTSYQASAFLAETVVPGELVHIKASITDHLERILLTQLDGVKCWRERCGVEWPCMDCRHYAEAHAPPFGLDGTMSVREIGEPLAAREASSA
jgi:UDP-N-acetylmuramoyl-tripeptide--D-alanyl-D-alanine ligase